MLRRLVAVAFLASVLPGTAAAQNLGVTLRAGTFGFGSDVALQLTSNFAVRVGGGTLPGEITGEFTDVKYTVQPPRQLFNAGIDIFPGLSDFHIGAGMLLINDETDLLARYTGNIVIDGRSFSGEEAGEVSGLVDHGSAAPYVLFGGGRHAGKGLGIFGDFGAAFLKEQVVTLSATGAASGNAEFRERLAEEERKIQEEVRKYVKVLPIISVGFRYGF